MEKTKLAILTAELKKQKEEIDKIYDKIKQRSVRLNSQVTVESLAYQLHNLYCAYEDLFNLVAEAFENNIEESGAWHKEMLRRMSISINGIRPNLIGEESFSLLSELKNFRHFFRHAYGYKIDIDKIKIALDKSLQLRKYFERDMVNFISLLKKGKD